MPQWLQKTWKHFVIVTPKVISPPWRFSFIPVSFLFVSERSGIYIFGPIPLKRPSFHGPTVVVLKGFHCTLIANSWHVPQSKRKVYTVHWINLYNSCSDFLLYVVIIAVQSPEGEFCEAELLKNVSWPRTPKGNTVKRLCPFRFTGGRPSSVSRDSEL